MKVNKKNLSFNVTETNWTGFWQNSNWEPYMWDIFDKYLSKDKNYLDVGAWIGPTVLYGSQLCRNCYAIEPDPVAIKELKSNIELNGFNNIHIYECALSDFTGKINMGSDNLGDSMFRFVSQNNLMERDCYTISDFFDKHNIKDVSFIKMDIEGGEERVLKDLDFFSKKIPMHLSLHHIFYPNSEETMKVISIVCKMYDNMYDEHFNKVSIEHIYNKEYAGFLSVILE